MSSTLGFIVIVIIYLIIGVLAVIGTAALTQRFLRPKTEQIFYGLLLIAIAALYIAFNAYFQTAGSWRTELTGVACFSLLGLVGVRFAVALILGYPLHGLWDLLHELNAHAGKSVALTAIPLAYGAFCATFDLGAAVYAYLRRKEWGAAWRR